MEMNYDDKELHEIEQELHTEILPGTEVMRDVGSHHFVRAGTGVHSVLVPQPSDDPADPLNWSTWWKASTITASTAVTFFQGFGPLALAPIFPYFEEEFNCSLADAIQFTGITILVLGFSNFIWVPLSTSFGRRPVYIASMLVCLASMIWRAEAKTYGSFMGACVVNGIGAGPAETIQPAVIADVFFLHDRGKWNTLYWVAYMGSIMVGPIISGPMAFHVGWRSFWWLNVGMAAAVILMVLFMFPETKWHRIHPDEYVHKEARKSGDDSSGEKSKPEVLQDEAVANGNNTSNGEISQMPASDGAAGVSKIVPLSAEETAQRDPYLGKGRPRKSQWKLYQPNKNPWKSILNDLWIPWKLFAFPIVEFAAFVVSFGCSTFLTLNLTQAQVFAAPPYLWSSQTIGFTNFAILVGAFIGLATGGPLSDWVAAKLTSRNGGIREPEMRLLAMIPYTLIMYIGNIIVSIGYQRHWHWAIIVVIGYPCAGIAVATLPSISSTYAVDSYKPVAGSLFVAITVNKNVWGYGFGKFITPWSEEAGFITPIMVNASLILFFCLTGVIFYFYGKTFRKWSKNSSVHRM